MTPRRSRRPAVNLLRGLASLLILLALLAGLPALLWFLTGVLLPHGVSLDEITTLLTSRNLGAPFFAVVMAGGWIGWAVFAVCTVLEIPAQLRGRPSLSMPSIGVQRLAATLVGGVLLLLPAGTAMAAPSHAAPAHAPTHVSAAAAPQAAPASAPRSAPAAATTTHYTVQPRDSLSKIAQQELGDAARWTEIAQANDGHTMTDGTKFSARGVLQPGWKLSMPKDWKQQDQTAEPSGARHSEHTVRSGENLSTIAEDELGDAGDYMDIARLNQGKKQDDGRTFTDPDEIYPGWKLVLPGAASAPSQAKPADEHPSADQDSSTGKDTSEKETSPTAPPQKPDTSDRDAAGSDTNRDPMPSASEPSAPATPAPERSSQAAPDQHTPAAETAGEDDGPSVAVTAAAVTSLFAAAVLAVLGARRAHQQRRRRHKRRIPMPDENTASADLEQEMRNNASADGLDLLHQALRALAANCARTGRPLPEIEAARLDARGLEVHLSAPAPAIAPFTESESNPAVWWCPGRGAALLSSDEARDTNAPYPALVSIGETPDGDPVLINLETIGLLQLHGSTQDVTAVMLGMAVELASSALTDDTSLQLSGLGAELQDVFPARVQHHPALSSALDEVRAHDALQRGALDAAGADSLLAARLGADGGDTWIPQVLMCPNVPTEQHAEDLADLLSSRPRTALAVITAADGALQLPGTWLVPAAPGAEVELPGLDLTVTLQRLEAEAYAPLLDLLSTANRTDDVPAPPWTAEPDAASHLGLWDDDGSALAPQANGSQPAPVQVHVTTTSASDSAVALPDFSALAPATTGTAPEAGLEDYPESDFGSGLSPEAAGYGPQDGPEFPVEQSPEAELSPTDTPVDDEDPASTAYPPYTDGPEPWAPDEDSTLSPAVNSALSVPADLDEPAAPHDPDNGSTADFDDVFAEVLSEQRDRSPFDVPEDLGADDDSPVGLAPGAGADGLVDDTDAGPEAAPKVQAPEPLLARVTAVTSSVLAALNTPPDPPAAPQIRVLGPVDVVGALGRVESNRRNSLTEIAAWLVLHPGRNRHELDEAVWPGQRVYAGTRNTAISKLRTWLGRDPRLAADAPDSSYLPPINNGVYAFNQDVTADWHQFKDLYLKGMHHQGEDADTALAHALALVRGRPFADIDQSRYVWAEHDIQEMISATVDVAHELAARRMAVRDFRAAANAASVGLTCDIQAELLYRDLFQIYSATGDRAGLERTAHQLNRISTETGLDSSPETVALLNTLLAANSLGAASA
ncbi:LysM peptidoglycan-binding domain-containing protein [Streptomyces sp. NPDC014872]|uniref:LysM peptidoglycan-binding domain-containing protein n=1 Tax=Streptomyces sp. NPDC014872 TaxID=3364926 RepID=UPI0036FAC938